MYNIQNQKVYLIKLNIDNQHRCWVGWSGSSRGSGLYVTTNSMCKMFLSEHLEEQEVQDYLQDKSYTLVEVTDPIRKSRLSYYYHPLNKIP